MKKSVLVLILIFIFVFLVLNLSSASAAIQSDKFSRGAMYATGQIGLKSYVATAEPFDSFPFPIGGSFVFFISDNLGLGTTILYEKWCDYLGCFCGKFTFHIIKPSIDLSYHFDLPAIKGMSLFAGANLGYSILSVSNELGNDYIGDLKSEPHIAPFLGTHLYFWENSSGFLSRVLLTLNVSWSVIGDFSGIYGAVGITYLIR